MTSFINLSAALTDEVLNELIPLSTAYLRETGFSTTTTIRNKLRYRLDISPTMRMNLTKPIEPMIDKIIANQQHQHISH